MEEYKNLLEDDEYKNKRKNLESIRSRILLMPNDINKVKTIEGYVHLFNFYRRISGETYDDCKDLDIDDDYITKYERYVNKKTNKRILEVKKLAPYLYQRFNKLINLYKENGFCSYDFDPNGKVNVDEMYNNLDEFLNILGRDVCNLYNKMIMNDNIVLAKNPDTLGVSMDPFGLDSPCMIIQDVEKLFDFYITLVHELGHCYQFHLQRNHMHVETFNPYTEITSTFFEKLFCEFLKTKRKYDKYLYDYELEDHIYFLNVISSCKLLCNLFINNDIYKIDCYTLKYNTKMPYEVLLKEMTNDCGYVMENKFGIELTDFHYAIGNVIARYFIKKIKNDFYGALKEYKNFICTVDNYPLKDVLDKYFDMDMMQEEIKTFTKSYHNR